MIAKIKGTSKEFNLIACLSITLLMTACSATQFSPSSHEAQSSLAINATSGDQGSDAMTSGSANPQPASSKACVPVNGDPLAFNLLPVVGGYPSIQITQLPMESDGSAPYRDYSVRAIYENENGEVFTVSEYTEATIDSTRLYGLFNCEQQATRINELAKSMGIPWRNLAPHLKFHIMTSSSAKLIGIEVKHDASQSVTRRCY